MIHISKLKRLRFHFTENRYNFFNNISTLLAFGMALNFFMIISKDVEYISNSNINQTKNNIIETNFTNIDKSKISYFILEILQMTICSIFLIFWSFLYSPLIVSKKWREYVQHNQSLFDKDLEEECNLLLFH